MAQIASITDMYRRKEEFCLDRTLLDLEAVRRGFTSPKAPNLASRSAISFGERQQEEAADALGLLGGKV